MNAQSTTLVRGSINAARQLNTDELSSTPAERVRACRPIVQFDKLHLAYRQILSVVGPYTLRALVAVIGLTACISIPAFPAYSQTLLIDADAPPILTTDDTFTIYGEGAEANDYIYPELNGAGALYGDTSGTSADDNGYWSLTLGVEQPGFYSVIIYSDDSGSAETITFEVLPGSPAQFEVDAPSSVTAGSGGSFIVTAEDQFGNLTSDYGGIVHFSSTDPNFDGPDDTSLSDGVGTFSFDLYQEGGQTITAADAGNSSISGVSNSIYVEAAAPAVIDFVRQPSDTAAGQTITPAVAVQIEDTYGNEVPEIGTDVSVYLTDPEGAELYGSLTQGTDYDGLSLFSNLSVDYPGVYTLTASDPADGLPDVTSDSFTIAPGAAEGLAFDNVPEYGTVGQSIGVVTVDVLDSGGNQITSGADSDVPVTISLATGTGAGVAVGAPITAYASQGTATFDNIAFSQPGSYTLYAASPGLSPSYSPPIIITGGAGAAPSSGNPLAVFAGDRTLTSYPIQLGQVKAVAGTTALLKLPSGQDIALQIVSNSGTPSATLSVSIPASAIPAAGLYEILISVPGQSSPITTPLTVEPLGPVQSLGITADESQDYIAGGLQLFSTPYDYSPASILSPDIADYSDNLQEFDFSNILQVGVVPKLAVWDPLASNYDISGQAPAGAGPENPADHLILGQGYWGRMPFNASPLNGVGLVERGVIASDPEEAGRVDSAGRFEIPLHPGWNMIGDPFAEAEGAQPTGIPLENISVLYKGLSVNLIQADANALVSKVFFRYGITNAKSNAYGYIPVFPGNTSRSGITPSSPMNASIYPYGGYWVYSWSDSTLLIPPPQ
jgi:hypothetical protein